jgi:hypothetical protein
MGNNLFGANISKQIANALGSKLLAATLVKRTPGTRDPTNPGGGTQPTEVSYSCRGFVDDYKTGHIDGDLVKVGDRKVTLLGDTISRGSVVPSANDKVTIEGRTYSVVAVTRDPDAATYTLQARG